MVEYPHILLIVPTYYPILGGAELAVSNIAKGLKQKNIKADVLTFNITKERWRIKLKTEETQIEGVKVYRLGGINLLFFLQQTRFKSLLMSYFGLQIIPSLKLYKIVKNYDIIHFNDEVNMSIPIMLLPVNKRKIFHIRTLLQLYKRFEISFFMRWLLKKSAGKFIVETDNYVQLLKKIGISEKRTIHWKKSVDGDFFKNINPSKNNSVIRLLFISARISDSNKGLHVLLEALMHINYSYELTIIAKLKPENAYSQKIHKSIEEINKKGKVINVLDSVPHKDLIKYYNESDIFVFTPLKDSMPNVLLEAAVCELPIISTRTGGIPDIVKDGETGFIVEPGDVCKLIENLNVLITDHKLRVKMGREGRKHVLNNYSKDASIIKLISIYKNL